MILQVLKTIKMLSRGRAIGRFLNSAFHHQDLISISPAGFSNSLCNMVVARSACTLLQSRDFNLILPFSFRRQFAAGASKEEEEEADDSDQPSEEQKAKAAPAEVDPKDRTRVIPWHVSAEYMKSAAYKNTYADNPVWKLFRRSHKGGKPPKKTRPTCVAFGRIDTGSPCPICRDEFLVLDYRNTELLKQFISPHTGEILGWSVTNVCQQQHWRMEVEMAKAKHFGTMQFKVPFRHYDYSDYYELPDGDLSPPISKNEQSEVTTEKS